MSSLLKSTSLVDSPKEHYQPDQLQIKRYEDALVKLIQSASTPLTIALQGEWGSGKTSLMNSLRYRLSDDTSSEHCFHSVWVNTWEYSLMREPQEAVVKILMSIITQIGAMDSSQEAAAASVSRIFRKIGSGIMVGAKLGVNVVAKQTTGVDNLTGLGQASAHEVDKVESSSEIRQAKTEIRLIIDECLKKTGPSKRGFLFFIDDLDRIDPPVAVQILELLKNVFDIGNCIFILAIDYEVVVKGLKPKFGEYSPATEREFRSFFDKIQHEWLIRFVEQRIGDQRIIRLIQKWLKAGVVEDGQWLEAKEGSPQGSVISPMLANLYLHYALDVWVKRWIAKEATGDMLMVRYADDAVLGFQNPEDAERFLKQLRERLGKFGLELHPDKTRLIEFGRFAAERRKKRGKGITASWEKN